MTTSCACCSPTYPTIPHMGRSLRRRRRWHQAARPRGPAGGCWKNHAHGERRRTSSETSPYVELDRDAWAELGENTDQPLSEAEVERVRGLGDQLDLDEVQQVYLPLSRLLSLYVEAAGTLHRAQEDVPRPARSRRARRS